MGPKSEFDLSEPEATKAQGSEASGSTDQQGLSAYGENFVEDDANVDVIEIAGAIKRQRGSKRRTGERAQRLCRWGGFWLPSLIGSAILATITLGQRRSPYGVCKSGDHDHRP